MKQLIKEFSNQKWSKRGVEDFQKRLQTMGSIEQAPGSGRPRTTRTAENVDAVGDLVQSQENQPLFSFAVNVNEQRIIAFLTEKCCYLNLRSTVRTQLS